mgnify:CR=1 FL=1
MELDDFLYTSAGRGRYACFTGTNRLMFITHRTNKYTELDEVKMVTKGGCTWVQLRMKENLNLEVAKAIAHFTLFDCDTDCACCLDDDLEMAFKAGIHCVHLGKNDIPVSEAWHRIIEKGKEDLFLVGTRDCPGQSVDLAAVAQMNLFLPRDYSAVRLRVDEAFSLRRLTAKVIGEIESIATLTAAIASGMGVTVLPESAARSLCNAANGWMARITTPSMNLPLSLNVSARGSLSPQAQAVKEILLSLVSRPALENRELQLVS